MRCGLVINDVVHNVVEAPSVEWCKENIGGSWLEIPICVGISESIYKRVSIIDAMQSENTLSHFYETAPRYERYFQISKVVPMSDADQYQSVFPLPIELMCSGTDFFLVPVNVVKKGMMDPFLYDLHAEIMNGSITQHEVVFKTDKWAISYVVLRKDIAEQVDNNVDPAMWATTLEELCQLLFEWEWAYSYGSREPSATMAASIVEELGLNEIREKIIGLNRKMQLGAYLSGEELPYHPTDPPIVLLPSLALSVAGQM